MSKNARTILTLLFFAAFLVSAPAVVLYTKGYRYDWRKTKIEETGILRIESVPTGATVFLNGVRTDLTTPASLFRLLPEQYDVRLERTGSIPWQKTLEVKSGETTFAAGIRLVSDGLPVLQTPLDAESAVFNADGSKLVFFRENGDWTEVGIADAATGETSLLARYGKERYRNARLAWSPTERYVAFTAERDSGPAVILYSAAAPHDAIAIHDLMPLRGPWFHWADDDRAIVAFATSVTAAGFDPGVLIAIEPAPTTPEPGRLPGTGIDAFSTEQTDILDADEEAGIGIFATDLHDAEGTRKLGIRGDAAGIVLPGLPDRILRAKDGRALLADTARGKLLLVDVRAHTVLGTYDATSFSLPPGEKGWSDLLLWNAYEISAVDAASGAKMLITRIGTPLRDVRTIPGLPLVAYATDAGITLIEREDTGGRATYDLSQFSSIGGIGIDAEGARLLFLGAVGNQRGIYSRGL